MPIKQIKQIYMYDIIDSNDYIVCKILSTKQNPRYVLHKATLKTPKRNIRAVFTGLKVL